MPEIGEINETNACLCNECFLLFKNNLDDISLFCGAIDTPIFDFW